MRGAAESTSCPGNLGPVRCPGRPRPGFQCLPRRPDFPGDSDKGRRARGVDQLSQVTRAVLEVLRARPAVLGHSGPCLRSCGLDQLSREGRARVRGPTVSTSSPGNPRFAPNAREFGQLPVDAGTCPRSCGLEQLSQGTWGRVRGPAVLTSSRGLGPMASEVDHLSRAIRARVRGPAGSISCPG